MKFRSHEPSCKLLYTFLALEAIDLAYQNFNNVSMRTRRYLLAAGVTVLVSSMLPGHFNEHFELFDLNLTNQHYEPTPYNPTPGPLRVPIQASGSYSSDSPTIAICDCPPLFTASSQYSSDVSMPMTL